MVAFGIDRRLAVATAVAVAGAFALGSISPFALPSRQGEIAEAPPPPPAAAPPPNTAHAVTCPAKAVVGDKVSQGHVDAVAVGAAAPGAPLPTINVPARSPITFTGWIVLASGAPAKICAIVDGQTSSARMDYGAPRPDVAAALGKAADVESGFAVTLDFAPGTHTVVVGAVEPDGRTVDPMNEPLNVRVR